MYLSNTINYDLATKYSMNIDECEDLWVKLLLGVVYKHPKSNAKTFLELNP